MSTALRTRYFPAALLLLLPAVASASASFSINGSCLQGVAGCPYGPGPGNAVLYGQTDTGNGSYNLTLGDGDTYQITWTYLASYGPSGTSIEVDPIVTYTGATTTTHDDQINFNMFENYFDASPGNWDGSYTENIPFSLSGAGPGSSITGQLSYDLDNLPALEQVGNGTSFQTATRTLLGLDANTLVAEYEFNFDFKPGTASGASGSSVPEPGQALPLGLVLLGFACYHVIVARRSSSTS